mmetsp:Transcript_21315/g.37319  ORF Transcript_21315/g.37319 Transcript_21315/m.37319 type:complete len:165 (+) Transcript_21315:458-952(+)
MLSVSLPAEVVAGVGVGTGCFPYWALANCLNGGVMLLRLGSRLLIRKSRQPSSCKSWHAEGERVALPRNCKRAGPKPQPLSVGVTNPLLLLLHQHTQHTQQNMWHSVLSGDRLCARQRSNVVGVEEDETWACTLEVYEPVPNKNEIVKVQRKIYNILQTAVKEV